MNALKVLAVVVAAAATIAVPSALAAPPANDDFASAAQLVGRTAWAEGTTNEATKEVGEPDHAGKAGGASIWYRWTAPDAGRATVSTCDSGFDTLLAVYTGDALALLDEVAANDNSCGSQSRVSFEAAAGQTYRIAVDGADGAKGTVWLALNLAPLNDAFEEAQTLAGDTGSVSGTTEGATWEDGEPDHLGIGWNSVWYRWTAPSSGWASFEACGSSFDTVLAVYTGATLAELSRVAGNDDSCGFASRVHFRASAGSEYMVALSGWDGEQGSFNLNWHRNAPPPIPMGAPRISGTAVDGEILTATPGEWDGDPPFSHAFAWGRCDREFDSCALIEGATSQTFTLRSVDVGFALYVQVTATNASGSTTAYSNMTRLVAARAPSNSVVPAITGDARPGGILVASGGAWIGTAPIAYTYQWQSCNSAGAGCSDLVGQTGQLIHVPSSAVGTRMRVLVAATNMVGSATAASEPTGVVRSPQVERCVVPSVRGRTLAKAREAIQRSRCTTGRVRRAYSRTVRKGRVISQTPRAGARLARGAKVNLIVSKGRKS